MKKLSLIIVLLIFGLAGCDSVDFEDSINADEDAVTQPNTKSLMAAAMNRFFTLTGRNYNAKPTLYVQYQSQYVYTAESRYGVTQGSWGIWYVKVLNSLDEISDVLNDKEADPLNREFGAPVNQIGVAKIFSAYVWLRVTNTWGPVPYKDALSDDELTPSYTGQEAIYKDLVNRLQTWRDKLDPSKPGPDGDLVYGGNVMKWKKFANSLLISMAIQMSEVAPDYAAKVFNEAINHPAGVIDDIGEEMWYNFSAATGTQNPFSAYRRPDYSLSAAFVSALKGVADDSSTISNPVFSSDTYDARIKVYAIRAQKQGRDYGEINGNGPASNNFAAISLDMSKASSALHYMTAAYTYLNRAEAAALGWTSKNEIKLLKKGIKMSYKTLEAHYVDDKIGNATIDLSSKAEAFAQARAEDARKYGVLQVIREEKWVSLFPRGFQAWSEYRRTEIPGLEPAPDALNANGKIPRRYIYPATESASNPKNYKQGVSMLSPSEDAYYAHFWWNVDDTQ